MIWWESNLITVQTQCEGLQAELASCQREHAKKQKHIKQLTEAKEEARTASRCTAEKLRTAEQDLQGAHEDCDR